MKPTSGSTVLGSRATTRGEVLPPLASRYDEAPNAILWMFCGYVISWFLQAGVRVHLIRIIKIEFITGLALVVLALARFGEKKIVSGTWVDGRGLRISAIVLVLLMLIQMPLSYDLPLSWDTFIDRVIKFGFMAVFISAFVRSPRDLRWFLGAFLLACCYITQESFRGALSGAMIWENQGVPRLHGDTPLFEHPNSLSGLAIGTLPFVIYLFPQARKLWIKVGLCFLAFTALGCILYSGSRTAYVGVVGLVIFYILTSKYRVKAAVIVLGIIVPVAWNTMPDIYKARFETIATGKEIEGNSMGARKEIIADAIAIFEEHPFGVGVAAFPTVRKAKFGRFQDTHNLYLEVGTNLGVQGLLVFFVFVSMMFATLYRVRKFCAGELAELDALQARPEPLDELRARGVLEHRRDIDLINATAFAVAGYIFIRMVLGLFGMDMYEIYWWIGLGCSLALCNISRRVSLATDALTGNNRVPAKRGRK